MPRDGDVTDTGSGWDGTRNASVWSFVTDAAASFPGSAERLLHDAAVRAARHPQGRLALVLHLSRLRPPAPRPHHARIARAILQEAALRRDGHVFAPRNGDLILICTNGPDLLALPEMLGRLLRLDAPEPAAIVSSWRLEQTAEPLLDYAAGRLADRAPTPGTRPPAAPASPLALDALAAAVQRAHWPDITRRQTAVLLAGRDLIGTALRPLFREVTVTLAAIDPAQQDGGPVSGDACLLGHFAPRLDAALLAALTDALGNGGPLDAADRSAPPLHLNLAVSTLLSPAFGAFAVRCRKAGRMLGAEVALPEAAADPSAFARARRLANETGWALVLDGVTCDALLVTRPWALRADLVKLAWSPLLPDLPAAERPALAAALAAIGVARLVLCDADDEAAIRWGLAQGIRRFQGKHVEVMLAAARMLSCPAAADCTLRQCVERAAATGPAARRFCRRPDLLDTRAPASLAGPG